MPTHRTTREKLPKCQNLPIYLLTYNGILRMLIVEFLPKYDIHEHHEINIATPLERIYAAVRAEHFRSFDTPGFAKAVWNFSLAPQPNGATNVSTDTRVLCLGEASRRRFRLYWQFIRAFSGGIRRAALQAIKREARANRTKVKA